MRGRGPRLLSPRCMDIVVPVPTTFHHHFISFLLEIDIIHCNISSAKCSRSLTHWRRYCGDFTVSVHYPSRWYGIVYEPSGRLSLIRLTLCLNRLSLPLVLHMIYHLKWDWDGICLPDCQIPYHTMVWGHTPISHIIPYHPISFRSLDDTAAPRSIAEQHFKRSLASWIFNIILSGATFHSMSSRALITSLTHPLQRYFPTSAISQCVQRTF